jgi:hypothetical protein
MLLEWGIKSQLTPAQLAFAFKKMADALKEELRSFVDKESSYEQVFLAKAVKCVKVQHELKSTSTQEATAGWTEKRNHVLNESIDEFQALCFQVPLSFLVKLGKACIDDPEEDDENISMNLSLTKGSASGALLSTGQNQQQSTGRPHNKLHGKLKLICSQRLSDNTGGSSGAVVRQRSRRGPDPVDEDEVLGFLNEQIVKYLDGWSNNPNNKRESSSGQKGKKKDFGEKLEQAQTQAQDGRLSFAEFIRVMFDAGITWLNQNELKAKFQSLDVDHSGKLNVAEVLQAASRIQSLVEMARDFERTESAKGRKFSQVQVLHEFARSLQRGEDLSTRFLRSVPEGDGCAAHDSPVTVSSGRTILQSLEKDNVVWSADEADREPWIEWDLSTPCEVSAVSTRGHPDNEAWVTRYRIEWWREQRSGQVRGLREKIFCGTYFDLLHHYEEQMMYFETEHELLQDWETLDRLPGAWVPYGESPARLLFVCELSQFIRNKCSFAAVLEEESEKPQPNQKLPPDWRSRLIVKDREGQSITDDEMQKLSADVQDKDLLTQRKADSRFPLNAFLDRGFDGNVDIHSTVENMLDPPIETTKIRLRVMNWKGQAAMRTTIYGHHIHDGATWSSGACKAPEPSRPSKRMQAAA